MGLEEASTMEWQCTHCHQQNDTAYRFCKSCGKPRFQFLSEFAGRNVYSVMALYFTLLIAILVIWATDLLEMGWRGELVSSLMIAGITLLFVFTDIQDFYRYIFPQRIRWQLIGLIVVCAPLFSFAVSNAVNWVNDSLFHVQLDGFENYWGSPNPLFFAILFTAVFPAIFEELAFRGVVFSKGKGVFSLKQSIWVSSILFTFLHLSVISFLWIMPFALVLGYLRARYRTVFYGICIHFLHNFTAVVVEYYHWDSFLIHH